MQNENPQNGVAPCPANVWRAAQLNIGFHRDPLGNKRDSVKMWSPKDGHATIHADPEEQEVVLVVQSKRKAARDVKLNLRQDEMVFQRSKGLGWDGISITDGELTVSVNGQEIRIRADGSVVQTMDGGMTFLEADGTVLKTTDQAEAMISSDGINLTRRTEATFAAIRHDGVIARARDLV